MNTTPNLTNVDSYNADITANATRYAASLFLGRGKYANAEATTLDAIKEAADKLMAENPTTTRKPIIVAFDADGNQANISGQPYKAPAKAKPAKAEKPAKPAKAEKPAKPAKAAKPAKEPKAAKPAKEPKAPKAEGEKGPRKNAKLEEMMANAANGILPTAPDFSADTHKPFRKKLAAIVEMIEAGNIKGLKAEPTEPKSSSRVILCRFRDAAIAALEAQRKASKQAEKETQATA